MVTDPDQEVSPSASTADESAESFRLGGRLAPPINPLCLRAGTPILAAHFGDPGQFLRAVDAKRGPGGQIAITTRADYSPGSEIILEISWPALPNRVYLRAETRSRRRRRHLVFRIYPGEHRKLAFLISCAQGAVGAVVHRAHDRFCVRLPVRWRQFGGAQMNAGVAEDLSASGARIITQLGPMRVGEQVVVRLLATSLHQDIVLTGRVRYVQFPAWDEMAIGVGFEHHATGEQRSLRCLLHAFAAKGRVLVDRADPADH